ncbi:MAG: DUF2147 domain-containing protein [Leptospiraceae bacterium]|nr:DUF2147 domain-containing protein [Leptospiraceae bacterium]MDW7976429.1 DUF2147 domain-containing protein [Leptospiraceae bacterium]
MKKKSFLIIFIFLLGFPLYPSSPVGTWIMFDHQGNPWAEVEIYLKNDLLHGRIVKLLNPKETDYTCSNCPDEFKDKPVEGLQFIWGLKKKSEKEYVNGKILVTRIGRIFDCDIEQIDNNKLKVRGYIGTTLIGRTQFFERKR